MAGYPILALLIAALSLAGCTSDPSAPVNRTFPIRQMDSFFNSLSGAPAPPSYATPTPSRYTTQDYTHHRGYAPAYPPY